jgi:magnesium transporter
MNFKHMPELEQPLGYPAVMALIIGLCGFLFYRFRRAGWL